MDQQRKLLTVAVQYNYQTKYMAKTKKEKKIIQMNISIKKIDMENFIINGVFSTEDEDRHGEIVYQNWDLKNFKKNPVILNSHNYGDITEILGKAIDITNDKDIKKLTGSIQFAVSQNPKAKIAFDLYAGGFANAFSVGFVPKEFNDKGDILKSELLEISLVSVPANAMALAKAKGIEVEKLYDKKDITTDEDIDDEEEDEEINEEIPEEIKDEETIEEVKEEIIEKNGPIVIEEEKSIKQSPSSILNEIVKAQIEIKKKSLQRIYSAVKLVSESIKVETRQLNADDRAETKNLINKTIRELTKLK